MLSRLPAVVRLGGLVGTLVLLMMAIGYIGLRGMEFSNSRLKMVYEDRTVALVELSKVNEAMLRMRHRMVLAAAASSTPDVEKIMQGGINLDELFHKN